MHNPKIILVVGVPRSGTTWMSALLAQCPGVVALQQAAFFEALVPLQEWWESSGGYGKRAIKLASGGDAAPEPGEAVYVGDELSPEDFDRALGEVARKVFCTISAAHDDADAVVLQTPENLLLWRLVLRLVPDAHFVHVIRDPRAVLASQRAAVKGWAAGQLDADPESVACSWKAYLDAAEQLRASGARYWQVRYEDLSVDPEARLSELLDWLELRVSPESVHSAVERCSLDRMKKSDMGPKGFVRHGLPQGWRDELGSGAIQLVEYFAGERMRTLGYETVSPHPERPPARLRAMNAARSALGPALNRESVLFRGARRLIRRLSKV